jgi:hypothetical protein
MLIENIGTFQSSSLSTLENVFLGDFMQPNSAVKKTQSFYKN